MTVSSKVARNFRVLPASLGVLVTPLPYPPQGVKMSGTLICCPFLVCIH